MAYARKRVYTRRPKKTRKYTKKKVYRNKKTIFRPQKILRVGFPKTTMVKLRYVDGISIDPGIGTLGTHNFRANSVYDPDYTGAGHQPMNFDMWAQLYNHYTVVGSKITVQLFDDNAAHTSGVVMGINLADDPTYTTDASTMMEQGLSRYVMGNASKADNKGRGLICSKTFSCKKFFNIVNPLDNTYRLGAGVSTNPLDTAHFIVFFGALPTSSVDFGNHRLVVKIDYIVIFSEPKEQPQS